MKQSHAVAKNEIEAFYATSANIYEKFYKHKILFT